MKKAMLILTVILISGSAWAGTFWVKPYESGSPAGSGTSHLDPWNGFSNIDWALLEGANTLMVLGTHREPLDVQASGQDSDNLLSIKGFALAPAVIQVGGHGGEDCITIAGRSYVEVRYFRLKGTVAPPSGNEPSGNGLLVTTTEDLSTHCIRLRNLSAQFCAAGIRIGSVFPGRTVSDVVVEGCVSHHNFKSGYQCYGFGEEDITIRGNTSFENGQGNKWGQGITVQNDKFIAKGYDIWTQYSGEIYSTIESHLADHVVGDIVNITEEYKLTRADSLAALSRGEYFQDLDDPVNPGILYIWLESGLDPKNEGLSMERGFSRRFRIVENTSYDNNGWDNGGNLVDGCGIYADWYARDVDIIRNEVFGNSECGIMLCAADNVLIAYNLVHRNGGGLSASPHGIGLRMGSGNVRIVNNTIVSSYIDGVRFNDFVSGLVKITNNIIAFNGHQELYGPLGYGINDTTYAGPLLLRNSYNCVHGNLEGGWSPGLSSGYGSITDDPGLDPSYRISWASACRNSGTAVDLSSFDGTTTWDDADFFDPVPVPYLEFDMGADEIPIGTGQ